MLHQRTISRKPPDSAEDYESLFADGLHHVTRLSSRLYTDHNVHDPGITTLELACYVLTHLAYLASIAIPDLLADDPAATTPPRKRFFTPREILPNTPVTARDYRKLLVDLVGVANAWIKPASLVYRADRAAATLLLPGPASPDLEPVPVKGLYDVLVEFAEGIDSAPEQAEVLGRVRDTLNANRNLCEDFLPPRGVERQEFIVCAELELETGADVSAVCAEIFFEVQQYLAPPVRSYSLAEMRQLRRPDNSRYTVAEIFEGPALANGFIPDEEIDDADLRREIRLSDLINIVMDIPGVRVVRDILINPAGVPLLPDKWVVSVRPDHQPTLDRDGSRLVFYKTGMPVPAVPADVDRLYREMAERARAAVEAPRNEDIPVPRGRRRNVRSYHSFQHHFPAAYGLGQDVDPNDARRRGLAFQLKAYLLFFDQVMADYCAQLDRVGDLFSTDPDVERTYFHQVVETFPQWVDIYDSGGAEEALVHADDSKGNPDDAKLHANRRHRFLDHLIARFAERFHEYAGVVQSAFGTTQGSLRRQKCRFLDDYPALSRPRGRAYDYALEGAGARWDSANVSGLERRLCRLLDLGNCARRDLSDVPEDAYAEVFEAAGEFRFRLVDRDDGATLLVGAFPFTTRAEAEEGMRRALRAAQSPVRYARRTAGGKFSFDVVDASGQVTLARRDELFDEAADRDDAIDYLVGYVRDHYGEEGLYVIENILLRTTASDDLLLKICSTPGCTDCPALDPYSYRIHVVLRADAGRFQRPEFRRYVEEVIRTETPAHILPKVCWIDDEDMAALETAYRAWVEAGPGAPDDVLGALIQALQAAKNVYPEQTLGDCDGRGRPMFKLGQAALGTLGDED